MTELTHKTKELFRKAALVVTFSNTQDFMLVFSSEIGPLEIIKTGDDINKINGLRMNILNNYYSLNNKYGALMVEVLPKSETPVITRLPEVIKAMGVEGLHIEEGLPPVLPMGSREGIFERIGAYIQKIEQSRSQ